MLKILLNIPWRYWWPEPSSSCCCLWLQSKLGPLHLAMSMASRYVVIFSLAAVNDFMFMVSCAFFTWLLSAALRQVDLLHLVAFIFLNSSLSKIKKWASCFILFKFNHLLFLTKRLLDNRHHFFSLLGCSWNLIEPSGYHKRGNQRAWRYAPSCCCKELSGVKLSWL